MTHPSTTLDNCSHGREITFKDRLGVPYVLIDALNETVTDGLGRNGARGEVG